MEVLRLLKTNPSLPHPPQEVPVDLTTGVKIHDSMIYQKSYPHLRFHPKHYPELPDDCLGTVKCERGILGSVVNNLKENAQVKEESSIVDQKKRRMDEYSTNEAFPAKRQKLKEEQDLLKDGLKQKLKKDTLVQSDKTYLSLRALSEQHCPVNILEHKSLMERLKNSKSNVTASSIKEIEALLAAVQQSQMLYYSYCAKLLHNLQARKLIGENEPPLNEVFKPCTTLRGSMDQAKEIREEINEGVVSKTCSVHTFNILPQVRINFFLFIRFRVIRFPSLWSELSKFGIIRDSFFS